MRAGPVEPGAVGPTRRGRNEAERRGRGKRNERALGIRPRGTGAVRGGQRRDRDPAPRCGDGGGRRGAYVPVPPHRPRRAPLRPRADRRGRPPPLLGAPLRDRGPAAHPRRIRPQREDTEGARGARHRLRAPRGGELRRRDRDLRSRREHLSAGRADRTGGRFGTDVRRVPAGRGPRGRNPQLRGGARGDLPDERGSPATRPGRRPAGRLPGWTASWP